MEGITIRNTVGALVLAGLFAGCSQHSVQSEATGVTSVAATESAVLLVSLSDGSVIQQSVELDADFCMKTASAPETTCFKRGPAIYDQAGRFVGHQMMQSEFVLYAAEKTSL